MVDKNNIKIYSTGHVGGPTNIRRLIHFMEEKNKDMPCKFREYKNNITEYIDSFIPQEVRDNTNNNPFFGVYILDHNKSTYGIRYPGFTTGYIRTNENDIIIEIGLYRDTKSTEMFSPISDEMLREKFIGTKLDLSKRRK